MKFEEALVLARSGAKIHPVGAAPDDYVTVENGDLKPSTPAQCDECGEAMYSDISGQYIVSKEWEVVS